MRPSTRTQLVEYCLRSLGHPVIEINVDDDQVEDRVDQALQFFSEYHFDGVEKVFLKYRIVQDDINNGYVSMTYDASVPGKFISGAGASGQAEDQLTFTEAGATGTSVNVDDLITSIIEVFHVDQTGMSMFDVRYQYALNDLYSFGAIDLTNYTITQQYLSLLRQTLSPDKSIRFSRKTNKLYIDMQWSRAVKPGDWLVIEAYRVMDPRVYPKVYDDMLLKKYLTALIKRQWASNLSKFQNVQLLGGVTFNGAELWNQANEEINKIETDMQSQWETGVQFFVG